MGKPVVGKARSKVDKPEKFALADIGKYVLVDLDRLVEASWNYKTDDEELSVKLAANLKRNGQIENIIVRELKTGAYEVVNGNHRFKAMQKLGATKMVACNMGKISDASAQRIAIETNETRYKSDTLKLSELIAGLSKEFSYEQLVETMPYSLEDMKIMTGLTDFSWDKYKDNAPPPPDPNAHEGDEAYVELKFRVPDTVANIFNEQLQRLRDMITKASGKECANDIQPIECCALILRDFDDDALHDALYGDDAT